MIRSTVITISITAILLALYTFAGAQVEEQADKYLSSQLAKYHIPGMSVDVVRKGQSIFKKGYGTSNVELDVPATPRSVYKLGSVTKNFTAAAVMLLLEDGKIVIDEKAAKYLPDVPNVPPNVTVRHLLTHTSGIIDYTEIPGSVAFARLDRTPKEVVKPALETPLRFTPGERYEYSNTNYFLLGMIIERVAKKGYGVFLNERIFVPLKMSDTRVDNLSSVIKNRVSGYNFFDGSVHNGEYGSVSNKWSSGGIVSTVEDLAKWDTALRSGKFLKPETTKAMLTPAKLSSGEELRYGIGNELYMDRGHRTVGHNGEVFGFSASFTQYIDDDLSVILLCNLGDVPAEVFARDVGGLFLGLPVQSYSKGGIEDKEPAVSAMVKNIILQAAKGEADASLFTTEAQNTILPLIKRAGPEVLGPAGPLKSFVLVDRRDEGDKRVYVYRSVFEKQSLIWTVELSKDGKVHAIEPKPE